MSGLNDPFYCIDCGEHPRMVGTRCYCCSERAAGRGAAIDKINTAPPPPSTRVRCDRCPKAFRSYELTICPECFKEMLR
jgi:hypothetical protein